MIKIGTAAEITIGTRENDVSVTATVYGKMDIKDTLFFTASSQATLSSDGGASLSLVGDVRTETDGVGAVTAGKVNFEGAARDGQAPANVSSMRLCRMKCLEARNMSNSDKFGCVLCSS